MSCTGGNSALPVAQPFAAEKVSPFGTPRLSTQRGLTRRWIMSGTASARSACLSPIDAELSIMKRRSILSGDALCSTTAPATVPELEVAPELPLDPVEPFDPLAPLDPLEPLYPLAALDPLEPLDPLDPPETTSPVFPPHEATSTAPSRP